MATMTLADLKAENEAEEAKLSETNNVKTETESESPPQADELETETEAATDETKETLDEVETESEELEETADWKKSEDEPQEGERPKLFTSDQVRAARIKGQEKGARRSNVEIDELKAEIDQLKRGQVRPALTVKPKREDFCDNDDPDEAYIDALSDYKLETFKAEQSAANVTTEVAQSQVNQVKEINQAVDLHYERAVKLSQESGIKPEDYQSADLKVREMIEELYPNSGDAITDGLIANLSDGSEKVMYNLGVNQARLNELQTLLKTDKSGIKAAIYLGTLKAKLTSTKKRTTNAPAPPDDVKGDKKPNTNLKALQKKHAEMHAKGDIQGAYNLKRQARKEGLKTNDW